MPFVCPMESTVYSGPPTDMHGHGHASPGPHSQLLKLNRKPSSSYQHCSMSTSLEFVLAVRDTAPDRVKHATSIPTRILPIRAPPTESANHPSYTPQDLDSLTGSLTQLTVRLPNRRIQSTDDMQLRLGGWVAFGIIAQRLDDKADTVKFWPLYRAWQMLYCDSL